MKFDGKIRGILKYVGFAGSIIMSIAYIICVFVLINGFSYTNSAMQTLVFAVINALVGFLITVFLTVQGISLAKDEDEYKRVRALYIGNKTKDKRTHGMVYFWVKTVLTNLLIKCSTIAASTFLVIRIVITARNDWNLLLLAVVNLLMFICFGLLALDGAYNYTTETYIPYMKERIKENNGEIDNGK